MASAAPRSPYRHLELCGIALALFIKALCRSNACGENDIHLHRAWF
ncbi:MAG: hypothetical protein PUF35_00710 [Subdoligranulum sp.]|nr:hypothetical protein [Subdoligranulum sp.]MDD6520592.1 hypothetical protein [Subdoligranulum sp.]